MKQYQLLNCIPLERTENLINEFAEEGWIVKAFNVVAEGELNQDKWAFVLLEMEE